MFVFPPKALFNRALPKTNIYAFARPTRSLKDRFVTGIHDIVWKYKLAPETVNLPARHGIQEIQVSRSPSRPRNCRTRSCTPLTRPSRRPLSISSPSTAVSGSAPPTSALKLSDDQTDGVLVSTNLEALVRL